MNSLKNLLVILVLVCSASYSQAEESKQAPESAKAAGPYAHTNSKGKTYYLFSTEVKLKNSTKVRTMYYFAKDPKNPKGKPLAKVPVDRVVSETKTGMLVLKKKVKAEDSKKK
ncbi:MAG: hypothetical protein ACSHYB_05665 [Roseibacillus sp.]